MVSIFFGPFYLFFYKTEKLVYTLFITTKQINKFTTNTYISYSSHIPISTMLYCQLNNSLNKIFFTSLVILLPLFILQTTCQTYLVSSQNINIPYNTFKFNTKSASQIYICIPQIQGNTIVIAYLMPTGNNLYSYLQNVTYYTSNNANPNHCDNQVMRTNQNVTKNTDYNLVMVTYAGDFTNSFTYRAQIGSIIATSAFTQSFSGTFSNNNSYYFKNVGYQPCISSYQLVISPPTGAPSINLVVKRTLNGSTTSQTYVINSPDSTNIVGDLVTDQTWSYQLKYVKQSYYQIYSYTIQKLVLANYTTAKTCCQQLTQQHLCHSVFNVTIPTPNSNSTTDPKDPIIINPAVVSQASQAPIGAIIGGVVGGLVFLIILIIIICTLCRRKRNQNGAQIPLDSAAGTQKMQNPGLKKVDSSQQVLGNMNPQQYLDDKCAACDGRSFCNVKCGSCGLKFHNQCIEKWIRNNGKCPRKNCQKSHFQKVIAEI